MNTNNTKRKTVVIGASEKQERTSNQAVQLLSDYGHEVVGIGRKAGQIADTEIQTGQPVIAKVDTISMYISPENQTGMYDYLLSLQPKRIIFNPGSENSELAKLAVDNNIVVEEACTLVLLRTGQY